ncbi:MAG: hypothetical protein PHH68_06685 [Candidatus Omnitrophica bacterium]|jgi:V/A-type H+-transporting ATPase subunit I|nr:hypothetical protein [Candidatus Omnitrophota bacterium]MDD5079989.1 hypothetical protein [Candidatus Omnitrophota bacterium]
MIVAMKKVYCICQAKDAGGTISQLRKLGVMHLEHQQVPQGKDITSLQEDINLAKSAGDILSRYCRDIEDAPREQAADWRNICRHIIDQDKRLDQLREYSRLLKIRISEWQEWGDFDPSLIERLSRKDILIRLYRMSLKELYALPQGVIVKKISQRNGIVNCLVISRDKVEVPAKEIVLPKASLGQMRSKLEEDSRLEKMLEKELKKYAGYYSGIGGSRRILEKELEFQRAVSGMGRSGCCAYLAGYAPIDACVMLQATARDNKWAISIREPAQDDNVPTLIRNPKWVELIKPVLGLLGITPGYRELDVSILFLIFFSVFFGIIIGDAGYGLVYLILTGLMHKKTGKNKSSGNVFPLFYLLSSCAVVWGMLTGTFFGQEWLVRHGVKPLVPLLNDIKFMQSFCFFLGALHLSIAHAWRAVLKSPSLSALADIGWIGVLWSAFFLARNLILSEPLPGQVKWLIIAGVGLVILFTNPQRNVFKAIGEGMGTIALSLMNNFTDVVSYVRLFAVGLAGVAIADTANVMASGLGNGVLAVLASAAIAVIGHSLNIALGPMSVLVHGVRLNVLEFSSHAQVSWSGVAYSPLKE